MYPGILIKLKSDIFIRNSIFDPGSIDQIEKKQISFRFLRQITHEEMKNFSRAKLEFFVELTKFKLSLNCIPEDPVFGTPGKL